MQNEVALQDFVSIGAVPSFVIDVEIPDVPESSAQINANWLLIDHQSDLAGHSSYYRNALKILDEVGLREYSNLHIPFNPDYQKLEFHSVVIHRGGQRIDKLDRDKMKVIQREKDLESGIFDGRYYMISFLEDVRIGDVLEYSYSLKGKNPFLDDNFVGYFPLQFQCPVERIHRRISHPDVQKLSVKHSSVEWEAYMQREEGECSWMIDHSLPYDYEYGQPKELHLGALVDLSSFSSWKEIIDWTLPYYELDGDLKNDHAAMQYVKVWKQEAVEDSDRALMALRFVQDEIRYLGLEDGMNSLVPAAPLEVFNQRFGDCKGKTQLLRAFLDAMDIRSYPCLVNARENCSLQERLPSPFAFDHVILCIELEEGAFFVDPTMMYQGGDLALSQCQDYKHGLILADSKDTYVELPKGTFTDRLEIETALNLNLNVDHSAKLEIKTTFLGNRANNIRYRMHRQKIRDMEKDFLSSYSSFIPSIKIDAPLEIFDHRDENQVTTVEGYAIEDFWKGDEREVPATSFLPLVIYEHLNESIDTNRKTPLALARPMKVREKIHLTGINESIQNWKVEHPAFTCSCLFSKEGKGNSTVVYEYTTFLESLSPEQLPGYAAKLKLARSKCEIVIPKHCDVQSDIDLAPWQMLVILGWMGFSIIMLSFLKKKLA